MDNLLSVLINAFYRAAEGNPLAQRMIVTIAQGYNNQMARINRTEPVQALAQPGETG